MFTVWKYSKLDGQMLYFLSTALWTIKFPWTWTVWAMVALISNLAGSKLKLRYRSIMQWNRKEFYCAYSIYSKIYSRLLTVVKLKEKKYIVLFPTKICYTVHSSSQIYLKVGRQLTLTHMAFCQLWSVFPVFRVRSMLD